MSSRALVIATGYHNQFRNMKSLLLLVGTLAWAQASFIDLNNITTPTDALAYVLNLKCIRERHILLACHYCDTGECPHSAFMAPPAGSALWYACPSE